MISIEKPKDLLGLAINNILNYRKDDPEFVKLISNWNKNIIIEIEMFYPLEITFKGNEIKFKINDFDKKIDLKVKMGLQALLDVAVGRLNPITAVIKRKIKIKGIYKIKTLLKFIKIFVTSMKMVMADPNINYYEIERNKR